MSELEIKNNQPSKKWQNIIDTKKDKRYSDVYTDLQLGAYVFHSSQGEPRIEIKSSNGILLVVEFWREDICRIKYAHPYASTQPSYALRPNLHPKSIKINIVGNDEYIDISSNKIICRVFKSDCKLVFLNADTQKIILKEKESYTTRTTIMNGVVDVKTNFICKKTDHFFGLGDKSSALNLQGKQFVNWNSDAFAFDKDKDPLYRSIPFFYGVSGQQAFGVFLNNTHKSHFDFNSKSNDQLSISAEGGQMEYFFFSGNDLNSIAQGYHYLTGTPELPPLWLLGFHQCRWSYYPESRVKELAADFRQHNIPCDALYLDIDYMDDYRCFTWNNEHFPNPKGMIQELSDQGFHTVVMIDPGIKIDDEYDVFTSGMEQNAFCRRASGELMIGPVWPTECVWPDFTRKLTRDWWGDLYKGLYLEDGVSGFWNDMNEPAVFKVNHGTFPDDVIHDNEGSPTNHKAVHNIYGQQMAKATMDGLKKIKSEKRPFLLSRATFSGGQRTAAIWTGDNVASWEQLELANRQCQRLSISGFSIVGTDIGGFVDQPEPELFVRWLQLSIFHPLFRVHSMGNNADGSAETDKDAVKEAESQERFDREPWSFGEPYTSQARKAIEFRYILLPYLYTSMYLHTIGGLPLIRSLSFFNMQDPKALSRENEFLFGPHLLVSPVIAPGATKQSTYLPAGEKWLDYETGDNYDGGQSVSKAINEDSIPIYVRAGAIIPQYPVQQYTNELKIESVTLKAFFGNTNIESHFYQDEGEGYKNQEGVYRLHRFTTQSTDKVFKIKQTINGIPKDDLATFEIKVYGLPFQVDELYIDGIQINIIDKEQSAIVIVAPADFKEINLS